MKFFIALIAIFAFATQFIAFLADGKLSHLAMMLVIIVVNATWFFLWNDNQKEQKHNK